MIISCPKCGGKLTVEPRLFGHLLGCPFCQARFAAPSPPRRPRPSVWQSFLSGFVVPFSLVAKFAKRCWDGLTSKPNSRPTTPHLHHSPHGDERTGNERSSEYDEDASHYYDYDLDENDPYEDDSYENDSDEGSSRERQYYDSHGMYVGYRDAEGWVHAEGGRNFIGRIDDDGTFYDDSGMYRGQVDLHDGSGYLWEDRNGYTGFQDGSRFSEDEHAGIPDIYEEGGEGTGGAFKALLDDVDDEDW